jgi:hypothetical protein
MNLDGQMEIGQERRIEAEVREGYFAGPNARGELILVDALEIGRQVLRGKGERGGDASRERDGMRS